MCAPIALGVASAAAGGLGAIGQHQSASAQAAAQNKAAVGNYKYQLKVRERNWDRERFRYNRQLVQYDTQVAENSLAAQRAYAGEQNKLNNIYKTAAVKQQGNLITLLQNSGKAAASGRGGKNAQRLDSAIVGQFGMNQAIQAESLMGAQMAYDDRTGALRREQIGANNKAYEKVAINPQAGVAPPPPVMTPGPSGLGLASGLLSAGIGGVSTANSLTPGGLFS
jgi:hypothetical protein